MVNPGGNTQLSLGSIIALLVQELPSILTTVKDLFHRQNPDDPPPTDEEIMQAFEAAFQSSREKDDQWLAAHPPTE